jgi:hypothetical protein
MNGNDQDNNDMNLEDKLLFKLVSPVFAQNLYQNMLQSYLPEEVPLSLFESDFSEYKMMEDAKILEAILSPGDCIFIPSRWFH